MSFDKRKIFLTTVVTLVLIGSACLFSPESKPGGTDYYTPVDSAYKVLANFQLAYQTKNLDAYMECLHDEFEFVLLEIDWDDYDGDGIQDESWGRDIEESMTYNMFNSPAAETINLTLEGNTETLWLQDPNGETLQLVRTFDLQVYFINSSGSQDGFHALGQAIFLCKPDENGDYKIWRWTDMSET